MKLENAQTLISVVIDEIPYCSEEHPRDLTCPELRPDRADEWCANCRAGKALSAASQSLKGVLP